MSVHAYFIQCITNLHVGSGDASYGIIDRQVQRDSVYDYPTIHSSSLKGALREHFEQLWKGEHEKINKIFGKKTAADSDAESGDCNFLNADLVALPVRCSHKQFALSLCPQSIKTVNDKARLLTGQKILKEETGSNKLFSSNPPEENTAIYLEDEELDRAGFSSVFNDNISENNLNAFNEQYAVIKDESFDTYVKDLPAIARNRVGENKNLWYEEVVPHQTVFITYLITNPDLDDDIFKEFDNALTGDNAVFQIGANSSVGYGVCKFHKLNLTQKDQH